MVAAGPGHQHRGGHGHGHGHDEGLELKRLGELEPGDSGTIYRLSCRGRLRRRLMDMGVVAGTPFRIERVAPLGDPIELKLKGFNLSLRKEEAGDIWVEVGDGS